jgi:Lrp/AsnC family transcriptional regulator, leucine-responsive regulatory protein
MVRAKPKLVPDAISIRLLGPGVADDTKEKASRPRKSSWLNIAQSYAVLGVNVLAYSVIFTLFLQAMDSLDATDHRILLALTGEARISNVDLAAKIGLSPSACLRRVQELERTGVIMGYRAVLDPASMGMGFVAYVALSRHTKDQQHGFEAAIAGAPQVRECHNVTGTFEYLLRVETRDLAAYKHFHTEVLGALPQVSTITSYVVMGSPKDDRG